MFAKLKSSKNYLEKRSEKAAKMKHLIRGSIACWDCKHFRVIYNTTQCQKNYDVGEGRECPDFEELQKEI